MITEQAAYQLLDSVIETAQLRPAEKLFVDQCFNRILAEDIYSKLDLPAFNKSAMDGFAILEGDESPVFEIIGMVAAGEVVSQLLSQGKTIKIMTGAPVPKYTGKIVPIEHTVIVDGKMQMIKQPKSTNICFKGEDIRVGDLLMQKGTRVNSIAIANLIASGIDSVAVLSKIKVSIISTGDEIVQSMDQLVSGKIIDANKPLLKALCDQQGFEVVAMTAVKDHLEETTSAIKNGLENADFVLISGGVSEGEFDYVSKSIQQSGLKIHFNRVLIKPGKPMTFASKENKFLFALPGNPVSVYIMFHLFVLRAFQKITKSAETQKIIRLPLKHIFNRNNTERTEYRPCRITEDGFIEPIHFHGSAHLLALMQADGFFVIPIGVQSVSIAEVLVSKD